MTEVTLASLAMDFDVRSAAPATQQTDQLRASTRALEEQAKATTAAMRDQAVSQGLSGTAAGKAVQAMAPLVGVWGQARDALGRFTAADGAFRMSQDLTAKTLVQNANAATAYARQQEQAAKVVAQAEAQAARSREADMNATATLLIRNAKLQADLTRQQEQEAATTTSYAAKVAGLKAQLDPFAAVQLTLIQRAKLLDDAMAHGAITADQHAAALSQVTRAALTDVQAIDRLQRAHVGAAEGARLQSYQLLNLGRQGADVFVSLASGQALWMVAVQQGAQIGEVFAEAATQGVGFKAALVGIAEAAAPVIALVGPLLIVGSTIAIVTKAAIDGEKAVNDFSNAVTLTGSAAGITADQYESMVSRVALSTQSGFGTARETILGLVASGKVSGDAIETLALDIVNLAEYTGKSTDEISKRFTGMKGSVADFAREFHDDYNGLISPAVIKHIGELEEQGKRAEATRLLYGALLSDLAEKGPAKVGVVEKAFRGFNDVLSLTLQLLSGIANKQAGAAAVGQINAAQLRNQIDSDKAILNGPLGFLANRPSIQFQIDSNQRQLDALLGANKPKLAAGNAGGMTAVASAAAEETELRLRRQIAEADRTNPDARLKLAESVARNDAVAKGISGSTLNDIAKLARQAEQKAIDRDAASAGKSSASAAAKVTRADNRGDNEVERALAGELAARATVTKNIEALAGIKKDQIEQELTGQKVRLAGLLEENKVNDADAKTALAAYDKAAAYKKQAVDQQLSAELLQGELASRQASNAYLDQMDKFASEAATTQQERNAIELAGLKRRQGEEAYALTTSNALKVGTGEISAMAAAETELRLKNLAFAQTEAALHGQAVETINRDLAVRQLALDDVITVAQSEMDLARSAGQRQAIENRIMAARHDLETASIQAAIEATNDVREKERLAKKLAAVDTAYGNQVKAANSAERAFYDIEGALSAAAQAIDNNDWAKATAALFDAFDTFSKKLKTSGATLEGKIGAIAGLAVGVGNMVGGAGGSAISGAGSGAMAGLGLASSLTTLGLAIPGPGWALAAGGAILGGLGGLFGGSSAKKKAKREAEARRLAEEQQRQDQIDEYTSQFQIDTLRAGGTPGGEAAAVAMERAAELAALAKLSPALVDLKQKYYDAADAVKAAADAEEKAAQVDTKRSSIQDEIDKLTLSSSELLTKSRVAERAEAIALDPTLGDLVDKLFGLQDAASAAADATAKAAADQDAWGKAFNDNIAQSLKNSEAEASKAAAAQEAYTSQMTAFANAADTAAHALDGAMQSLTAFADSLKAELGIGTTGGSLAQAERAFKTAVATGDYDAIPEVGKAYVDAAKNGAGSQADYLRIVAQVRQASLNSVTSAKSDAYQGSLTKLMLGALFSGDSASIQEVQRLRAAGLPGFANGGSFTFGGNPGVDQNVLSLNNQPIANVSYGETAWIGRGGASNDNSQMAALVQRIASLEARLGAALDKIADNTSSAAKTLKNVTPNGNAVAMEAAS